MTRRPLVRRLVNRLDAILSVAAYCTGSQCRNPWRALHPDGSVNSLLEAMSAAYDAQYDSYLKFNFQSCNLFYNPVNEYVDPSIQGIYGLQQFGASGTLTNGR